MNDELRSVPIFAGLGDQPAAALTAAAERRTFRPEEAIVRRGDAGGRLFVIVRGQVSVTLPSSEGPELRLGTLKAGEVFGEMSVFDDEPRSATVTAIEPTETLSLNTTQVLAFLGEHPEAAIAIIRLLVRRLRDTNTLAESVRADASAAEARRARSSPSG